jgi:hypothetical protein
MSMNTEQANTFTRSALERISALFYAGDIPYACGLPMVAVVMTERGATPNGNLTPTDDGTGLGLVLSDGLLAIKDDITIKFAIAHELGHGTSEHILTRIGLGGIAGEATEVIADISSAYLLVELGTSWDALIGSIRQWRTTNIFDDHKSGDHPAGDARVAHVEKFRALIDRKVGFNDAARQICEPLRS